MRWARAASPLRAFCAPCGLRIAATMDDLLVDKRAMSEGVRSNVMFGTGRRLQIIGCRDWREQHRLHTRCRGPRASCPRTDGILMRCRQHLETEMEQHHTKANSRLHLGVSM